MASVPVPCGGVAKRVVGAFAPPPLALALAPGRFPVRARAVRCLALVYIHLGQATDEPPSCGETGLGGCNMRACYELIACLFARWCLSFAASGANMGSAFDNNIGCKAASLTAIQA